MTLAEKVGICVVAAGRIDRGKFAEYEAIQDAARLAGFEWQALRMSSPAIGQHAIIGIFFEHKNEYHYFSACDSCTDSEVIERNCQWYQWFKTENAKRAAKTA